MSDRTTIIKKGSSGCIEDRTFIGAEEGELNQVPGADIFFSFAKDIVASANGAEANESLIGTVLNDVGTFGSNYTVHNDRDHGGEYDGCGFAARITDISTDLMDNFDEVFAGAGLLPVDRGRAEELRNGLAKLLNKQYFSKTGGELIEAAVKAGANLVTYIGDHTATQLTEDERANRTYNSVEANDPEKDSDTAFNLDSNHAKSGSTAFGLSKEDSYILAKLLSTSTVRVLSGGEIIELRKID